MVVVNSRELERFPFLADCAADASAFVALYLAPISCRRTSTTSTMVKPFPNIRVMRDVKARNGFAANEIARRAYLYVARNQALPPQVRYQAQLQLNSFDRYTRPTSVKNRCTESGRGRGVISEFGLCRVSCVVSVRGS